MDSEKYTSGDPEELFNKAACGLLRIDAAGTFLLVNDRFCQWTGYTREQLVKVKRLQDLLTMGGKIFHQTHWTPLLQMQGSVSEVKLDIRHSDGHAMPMVLNALRHASTGPVIYDLAAFVANDRHKYEQELLKATRRLSELVQESNELRELATQRATFAEQMMGIVSHDMRNPLSTIQMSSALLKRSNLTVSQISTVERISRAADHSSRLIADLLDFTASQLGGGISIEKDLCDLHAVVYTCVEDLSLAFPHAQLQHENEGTGLCTVDTGRLTQLIGNLVANAASYGSPGTAITVTSSIHDAQFIITVHNFGPAIPEATQKNLFKPMSRGTKQGEARSVGLGLFIVAEIVRAHGGEISVRSDSQHGTVFTAVFPR